ncbi:aspartate kinase [Ancylomarina euxinus]|uniref:Aspartokinase n=1 Tax=Ancylomarina euxinus TaxID=2283627 RepID=A0A425XXI2_9BACT|nr:aspartate kinase [Ancylomarina euxinus]MCZ4696107.1 aspartate kinase [Ancylomarina euxinus]MUP16516.1 aspartate kinase [Ancylomarina euxinus]RRG19374.1 aspartate kinase [Ancylomarina euxinus]
MKILKFGGTSVGTPERIQNLAQIVQSEEPCIVVLSAMAGTTNALVEITELLYKGDNENSLIKIEVLEQSYISRVNELFTSDEYLNKGLELISSHFIYIRNFVHKTFTQLQEKAVLAQGELISTAMFHYHLSENNIDSVLLPALNFMRIDKDGEPDSYYIQENLKREICRTPQDKLFITQGYICRNAYGEVDNLHRGGSDYSASLIGAAISADEVQIWTDIDGFHNNDPRFVEQTQAISELSFDEAAELAYFGAKIMHPASVLPCKLNNIPVRLKNTLSPCDVGTLISNKLERKRIKAVAAKDGITAVKIKSGRMLLAYGFLRKIFEVFEIYKTPIDMITTSEVAVSLTIDDTSRLEEIENELKKFGTVEIDKNQSIICIVGDFISEAAGSAKLVLEALDKIPLRMISYGGSSHNISVLVDQENKVEALKSLNKLFS